VDYGRFIKKLECPVGFTPAVELRYEDVVASMLTRSHLRDDVAGINVSIHLIRRTRGGPWPTEPVSEDYDFVDLVWHELEFRERDSFSYAVYNTDTRYLGCCYLYPLGRRTQLTEQLLEFDVDVSWWVTPTAYEQGYYTTLHDALRHWLANEFPFWQPYYSNAEIPH
jgi:RimJ/RimL family protein N-acetyltransferase